MLYSFVPPRMERFTLCMGAIRNNGEIQSVPLPNEPGSENNGFKERPALPLISLCKEAYCEAFIILNVFAGFLNTVTIIQVYLRFAFTCLLGSDDHHAIRTP